MKPYQVGITGGIGSGKSTIAKIFASLGVPVYDADSRAKSIMNSDALLVDLIKKEFGEDVYQPAGQLNRPLLASKVFDQPERLAKLNSLVHPRVGDDYEQWVQSHHEKPYVLKEAALLFESGSAAKLDKVIVVTSPMELRMKRVMQRDGRSEEEIKNIIQRQFSEEKLLASANFIITNNEVEAVLPQVLKLHQQLLYLAGH